MLFLHKETKLRFPGGEMYMEDTALGIARYTCFGTGNGRHG